MGVLIARDQGRADTTRAGRAGHTKARRQSAATFPSASKRQKGSALLYSFDPPLREHNIKRFVEVWASRVLRDESTPGAAHPCDTMHYDPLLTPSHLTPSP